jgi:hypothetical protein
MKSRTSVAALLGILALVLAAACVVAYHRATAYRRLPEYQVLLRTGTFGVSGGYGGDLLEGAIALQMLAKHPRAAAAFRDLLGKATLEGQLYALAGLAYADSRAFARALPRYRDLETRVETLGGCIVMRERVCDLARAWNPLRPQDPRRLAFYDELVELQDSSPHATRGCRLALRFAGVLGRAGVRDEVPFLSWWVAALAGEGREAQEKAHESQWTGDSDKVVAVLKQALVHEDAAVRQRAAETLSILGPWARDAAPALLEALGDTEWTVRGAALEALDGARPFLELAPIPGALARIAGFIDRTGEESHEAPETALRILACQGPHGLAAIARVLSHGPEHLKPEAASLLTVPAGLPFLFAALDGGDPATCALAVEALAAIEPAAKEALPRLEAMRRSLPADDTVLQAALDAAILALTGDPASDADR